MCLEPERVLDRLPEGLKCGWVGSLGQGAESSGAVARRGVEFTWRAFGDIDGDYATNFFTEWLDCN